MTLIDWLTDPHAWASFITLSAMEIVLGIDNVVFISLMVSRMAPEQRLMARRVGLSLALDLPRHHARRHRLYHSSDDADLQRCGLRLLLARPHPDRRRPVPSGQGHARDASRHRRRGGGGETAPAPASSTRWPPPFSRSPSSISSSPSIRSSPRSAWPTMSR